MAVIQLGDVVVGIRGSVGGVTYSAGKAGCYARAWSRGPNVGSTKQQGPRGRLSALGAAWAGLTGAQQAAWDALSGSPPEAVVNSLGETVVLSGWQWFCKLVSRRWLFADPPSYLAPGLPYAGVGSALTLAVSAAGACSVDLAAANFNSFGDYVVLFLAWESSGGVLRATRNRRLVKCAAAPGATTFGFGPEAQALWASLPVGGRATAFVSWQLVNGTRTAEVEANCIITA